MSRKSKFLTGMLLLLLWVVIAGLVWRLGLGLGLGAGASVAGALIIGALVISVLVLASALWRKRKPSHTPETAPKVRNPWRQLRVQVEKAIQALGTTRRGNGDGIAGRVELPWYLVLGAGASGKSAALVHSGLSVPLETAAGDQGDSKGCRWVFSTQGVFLDLPGRYVDEPGDRPEWLEFLRLLKRHRRRGTVRGILATLDLPRLLDLDAASLLATARSYRRRIGEAEARLGERLPVYLLVTHMDLLPGFSAFSTPPAQDLPQILPQILPQNLPWGAALPHEQKAEFHPLQATRVLFERLLRDLEAQGERRLREEGTANPFFTLFPAQFRRLGGPLEVFFQGLLGEDPYHARPFLRGFHFASALQDGDAPDRHLPGIILGEGTRLPAPRPEAGRPRFLAPLFQKVLLPDHHLASHLAIPRRTRARLAYQVPLLGLVALLGAAWTTSFLGNRRLVNTLRDLEGRALMLQGSPSPEDRLRGLLLLQRPMEQLQGHRRSAPPLSLRWGLYQGERLEARLRHQYFSGLSSLMLRPVQARLEDSLRRALAPSLPPVRRRPLPKPAPSRPERPPEPPILRVAHALRSAPVPLHPVPGDPPAGLYDTLKTYLMLHDPRRMDPDHLAEYLPRFWRPFLDQGRRLRPDQVAQAESLVAFYVSQIREPDLPTIGNDPFLVAKARMRLRAQNRMRSPLDQAYLALKVQANDRFASLTLGAILRERDLDLLSSPHAVQGCFTRSAYDQFLKDAFREAEKVLAPSDWVLAAENASLASGSLEARYEAEFMDAWETLLQGISIHGFGDARRASQALARLGDAQVSPIKVLLARVAQETAWAAPSQAEQAARALKDRTVLTLRERLFARTSASPSSLGTLPSPPALGHTLDAVAQLAKAGEGGAAPVDAYLQLLQKVQTRMEAVAQCPDPGPPSRILLQSTLSGGSEISQAAAFLESSLIPRMGGPSRGLVRPILLQPLRQAVQALVPAAEEDLDRAWEIQVWKPWTSVAHRYPFSDSPTDAALSDIQKILRPGEGALSRFIEKELGPLVAFQGQRMVPRTWEGSGLRLSRAFLDSACRLAQASHCLQDQGPATFELQPVPVPGIREITVEIDGQRLHYANGPQAWIPFTWPGPAALQGVRILAVADGGDSTHALELPGRLGLLRLLEQADAEENPGGTDALRWHLRPARGQERQGSLPVRFNFRMVGGPHPSHLAALRHHALPRRTTS